MVASGGLAVLVIEGDAARAEAMRHAIARADPELRVRVVDRLGRALDAVRDPAVACAVTALRLPDAEGAGVIGLLRTARGTLPVVAVGFPGADELAAAALKGGAADYVSPRARWLDELPLVVRETLGRAVLTGVIEDTGGCDAPPAADLDPPVIAVSDVMHGVLALVERAAPSRAPVLIEGETGTGKELIARAVHGRGPRRDAPFLVQNCAALPEALLESELFGHLRGAFTGAAHERRGLFAAAGAGTVFLDEIAEASLGLQAKLLRVLQHDEVKAVGADRPRPVEARIVAASNRALEAEVRAGRFRGDLYWRLAVFPIVVPPLRHRAADVGPLARHFLRRWERREARMTGGLDADALRALQDHAWPGNVRELENEMHRLVLSARSGERLGRLHLARRIREATPAPPAEPLARILRRVETALVRERLRQAPTKSAAARSLGITREALYAKMRRLGIARAG